MDQIAVLLPCFNEAQTIGKVVADFRRALPGAAVYVYDNNSTGGTASQAEAAGAAAVEAEAAATAGADTAGKQIPQHKNDKKHFL